MKPRTERNRRRDQTARLPGHWRHLGPRTDRGPQDLDERDDDERPDPPDAPIPAGALALLGSTVVRVYATIEVGAVWDGTYRVIPFGQRTGARIVTRDQLQPIPAVQEAA